MKKSPPVYIELTNWRESTPVFIEQSQVLLIRQIADEVGQRTMITCFPKGQDIIVEESADHVRSLIHASYRKKRFWNLF